jgi:signal transduction histidine kinase
VKPLRSLQARITSLVVAVTSAVWISASAAMWLDTRHELDELLDAHLMQAASFLLVRQAGEDEELEHGRAPAPHPYAPRVAFQVFEGSQLRSRSADAPSAPLIALDGRSGSFATVSVDGARWRAFSTQAADRDVRIIVAEQVAARSAIALAVLRRIGDLLDSERRFTADAAHELRTPIAAIRAQAQAALTVVDAVARRHALRSTIEGCDRAARLIDQLLLLARLESGTAPELAMLDLADLTRRVLAEATPDALIKGQHLELDAPDHVPVLGSMDLLRVLLRNLVDNAIRYSQKGARVSVTLRVEPAGTVLTIEDAGPGLAEPERLRLGDRFFRGGAAQASGSGLGWSIARRIAALHRLDVVVDRSPQLGGLRVRLTFPRG